jgi:hypothetical protein
MKRTGIKIEKKLLEEAIQRGFKKGIAYVMNGEKYKIKGDLFVRKMFIIGKGKGDDAFDYYVINHYNGNGFVYSGKTKEWGNIK